MKKIIALVLLVMPSLFFAQTAAFDKFKDVKGIEYLTVSKDMFKMLGNLESSAADAKTQKYVNMAKNIENLKVFTTSEKKYRKEITAAVTDYLKTNPLEQMMSFSSQNAKVKIYANESSDASIIKEFLVFVEDVDDKSVVLLSFTGDINLNDLDNLK
ncbi:MAG: DUF4252 domain-containing protein [Pedobacter sp.]|nr:MAG: DUF4252 domain-containing protein [Pedobacter sp.]